MAKTIKSPKQYVIIIAGIVALIAIVVISMRLSKTPLLTNSEIINVKKGAVTGVLEEEITITSVTSADLAFENSGKIKNIYVEVGDQVKKGQLLAEEVNSDYAATLNEKIANQKALEAQVEAAQENISIQNAKLHGLKNAKAKKYDKKAQILI